MQGRVKGQRIGRMPRKQNGDDLVITDGVQLRGRGDLPWDEKDQAHYDALLKESSLKNQGTKEMAARRATELSRQIRLLDAHVRTVDEEKILISSSIAYRKWLEALRVTQPVVEETGEL